METLETLGNGEGNTKTSPKTPAGRCVPGQKWCFTYNNYPLEILETLETTFSLTSCLWGYGKEVAPTTGTRHLQGWVISPNKIRPIECFKLPKEIQWIKMKGTKEQNIAYCSKEGSYRTNVKTKKIVNPLDNKELYPYQKYIIDLINKEPDNRTVNWFYEEEGNTGKTSLAKHLCLTHPKECLFITGKANDIKYAITEFNKNEENDLKIVILHYTRSNEDYVSYEAIESIKDGIMFSGKYESGMVIFNSPHVICFANFAPNEEKLSKDRWFIRMIEHRELVPPHGGTHPILSLTED